MLTIDGIRWPYPVDVTRQADVKASDISGLMMDRSYFNDVLGTYMVYTVKVAVPVGAVDEYATLYEAITNPIDGHAVVLPYNGDTVQLTARVSNISDVWVRMPGGRNAWKGIQFTLTSNYPTKAMSLGQMVVTGRAPYPPVASPRVGDSYRYTTGGWVPLPNYADADDTAY